MEIVVLEQKKNRLHFELKGAGHTLCNALKTELYNDEHVKAASYVIRHPQIGVPQFVVETDASSEPKKVLQQAVVRLKKQNEKFRKEVAQVVK